MITLHQSEGHRNVMFDDLTSGGMVQANQHIILHGGEGMLLDPGGHKVYSKLFAQTAGLLPINNLKHLFFSHQDPDIVASMNGWLMVTDARAYLSSVWTRFVMHFGVDDLVVKRIVTVPDEGLTIAVGGSPIKLLPAHFLHSCGNLQVYDPVSKILYSGDLGASVGQTYSEVSDFDAHLRFMEGFHRRYMPSNKALRMWARMVRTLDIETLAPQHGAIFRGRALVERFIGWVEGLECGLDLIQSYSAPAD